MSNKMKKLNKTILIITMALSLNASGHISLDEKASIEKI
jgi:hypothetical protein